MVAPHLNQRNQTPQDSVTVTPAMAISATSERHWTVAEVASIWSLSKDTVRRMFQNEAGVLVLGTHSSGRKRGYLTLRIPQSVLERVHRRCSLFSY